MTLNLQNDLLLRVARGEAVERPPVWIMRQAGRYLKEYRAVRKQAGSFKGMIEHPELAAEVTLQPIDIIGTDAAIIFSDILVIPEAMGRPFELVAGKGPVFEEPIRCVKDIDNLPAVSDAPNLSYTYRAIQITKRELNGRVPIIGFAGAPWTLFCYLIEGEGSRNFIKAKRFLFQEPTASHKLLQHITDMTILYLKGQIQAGADIIKIFDSWAGNLTHEHYLEFAYPYIRQICDAIQNIPKMVFAKGAYHMFPQLAELDCQIIALDWQTSPELALPYLNGKALQGNLDPCVLYAPHKEIEAQTLKMLRKFPPQRHVANLGHGINPDISPDHVKTFVQTIKSYEY